MTKNTEGTTKEKLLDEISAESIHETYEEYGSISPNEYKLVLHKKLKEHEVRIPSDEEQSEILKILEKIHKLEKKNQQSFQTLLELTVNAKNAIENKDKYALAKIEESTKEFLEQIVNHEKITIQDKVTGYLNKNGFVKYCLTKEGLFFFDGALFVFSIDDFDKLEHELSQKGIHQILQLFCENIIRKATANIVKEDIYLARFEKDKFVIAIKLNVMPYFSLTLQKMQKKPLKLQIKKNKTFDLRFKFSKSMFAKFGNDFKSVLSVAEKKLK